MTRGARVIILPLFLINLLCANSAPACIWDYDTLRDEQRGLPGVAEILSGRFEKRSDFFYRNRIARMETLLAAHPDDLNAIDNLAVALFRTGDFDRAVAVLNDKEKRFPNEYTTASNQATFYMLHGDVAHAIPLLKKSLQINPNAHFGREQYQLKLAEYLQRASKAATYPTEDFLGRDPLQQRALVFSHWNSISQSTPEEREAIEAIVGMIRFGTDRSPDLYFALGNLLSVRGDRHLALRAYLRAADLHHPHEARIREEVVDAVRGTIAEDVTRSDSDEAVAAERAAAERWAESYKGFADELIRGGKDPDAESNYASFYRRAGAGVEPLAFQWDDLTTPSMRRNGWTTRNLAIALCMACVAVFYWSIRRRVVGRLRALARPRSTRTQDERTLS